MILSMNTSVVVGKVADLIDTTEMFCTDLRPVNSYRTNTGRSAVPVYVQVSETAFPPVVVPLNCTVKACGRAIDASVVTAHPRYVELRSM